MVERRMQGLLEAEYIYSDVSTFRKGQRLLGGDMEMLNPVAFLQMALYYMPDGAQVRITVETIEAEEVVKWD